MLRIAMLSFWHVHAQGYLQLARSNTRTSVVALWDEIPTRGQAQANALNVPYYQHLDELLKQANVDAVIVDAPTTMHRNVMVAAAQAGKHIFTEKVLAPTLHESHQIVAAVEKAGVRLMVSLPRLYAGDMLAIKAILDRQLLGQVTQVRVRMAHDGALKTPTHPRGWLPPAFFDPRQTAGGAMIDLGSHPMYLTRYFLGLPESVSATYGYLTGHAVEDNAVATLRYPDGALGIVESGFVNPASPFTVEVHGTEGSLLYGTPESHLFVRTNQTGTAWNLWKEIPADLPSAFQQWVQHIQQGTTATNNIQVAIDLSALMEASNLSASTQQSVRIEALQQ